MLLTAKTEAGGEAGPAAPEEGDTPVSLQTLSYQLTQLCTNVNLTDEGGPGAMPDPRLVRLRGMVAAHQQDAAVEEYLQVHAALQTCHARCMGRQGGHGCAVHGEARRGLVEGRGATQIEAAVSLLSK